ncbi:MAG: hypothetical protein Q9191_000766 [Dirinaria sp. TL-2023a]
MGRSTVNVSQADRFKSLDVSLTNGKVITQRRLTRQFQGFDRLTSKAIKVDRLMEFVLSLMLKATSLHSRVIELSEKSDEAASNQAALVNEIKKVQQLSIKSSTFEQKGTTYVKPLSKQQALLTQANFAETATDDTQPPKTRTEKGWCKNKSPSQREAVNEVIETAAAKEAEEKAKKRMMPPRNCNAAPNENTLSPLDTYDLSETSNSQEEEKKDDPSSEAAEENPAEASNSGGQQQTGEKPGTQKRWR